MNKGNSMSKDEALDLALEALESKYIVNSGAWRVQQDQAIIAIKQARALDKMAENARELGLDYEPAPVQEPVAWMVTTEMQDGTKNTYPLIGRFKDVKDVCDFGDPVPLYTAPPAPTVQEPLGYLEIDDIESQSEYPHNCRNVNLWHEGGQGMAAIYTAPPAAQRLVAEPHKWVGLTDDEMKDALLSVDAETKRLPPGMKAFAQAILAKSKEKNT